MRDTTTITITIIIEPVGTGMFAAWLGGRLLCTSHEPLLAAARVLIAEGVGTGTTIAMQHMDSTVIALRAKIGIAAKTTVEDCRDGVPRFRRWKAPPSVGPMPPMRVREAAAPGIAPQAGALSDEDAEVAP